MTHPEALTFPELLETVPNDAYLNIQHETEPEVRIIPVGRYCHNAAAALRRLQVARERDNVSFKELLAQRDALLDALRGLLSYANVLEMRLLDADGEHRAMKQARAAIAKAEGDKT